MVKHNILMCIENLQMGEWVTMGKRAYLKHNYIIQICLGIASGRVFNGFL